MLFYCIDDPSVLLEAETEFLNQLFGDENEICTDKENIAPNTSTLGKPASKKNKTKSPKSSLLRRGLHVHEVLSLGKVSVQGVTGRKKKSKPLPDNVINMATEFGDKGKSVWGVFYSFVDFGM